MPSACTEALWNVRRPMMAEAGMAWTPEDPWWVRDNVREAIDRVVDLGYKVPGGVRLRLGD